MQLSSPVFKSSLEMFKSQWYYDSLTTKRAELSGNEFIQFVEREESRAGMCFWCLWTDWVRQSSRERSVGFLKTSPVLSSHRSILLPPGAHACGLRRNWKWITTSCEAFCVNKALFGRLKIGKLNSGISKYLSTVWQGRGIYFISRHCMDLEALDI